MQAFQGMRNLKKMHQFLGVSYQYENILSKISMEKKAKRVKLTPGLLLELSEELRLQLKNAVDIVDFEETMTTIKKIPAQSEAKADALTELVNQYRFDRLHELINDEPHINHHVENNRR
jgi:hypothetical protein